jgi:hypothetical protein
MGRKAKEAVTPTEADTSKIEVAPKVAAPKEPGMKKAIITDRETLLKLQDEKRLFAYDSRTGEATYKEE